MRRFRRLRDLSSARDGVSAIEFALVGMILALLCIAIVDFGRGIWEDIQVGNAARAGADFAAMQGYNYDKVVAAAQGATSLANVTATARTFYGCPTSSGVTEVTAGYLCGGLTEAAQYAEVDTTVSYQPILPYPGLNNLTLSATSYARLY